MKRSKQDYSVYIPQEILMEILLLLPFEFVIAWMRVSKEWNNVIKTTKFRSRYRKGGPLALFVYNGKIYSVLAKKTTTVTAKRCISLHPQFSVSQLELKFSLEKMRESTIPIAVSGTCCLETTNGTFIFYDLFNGSHNEVESDTTLQKYIYRGPKMTSLICCGYGYDCYEDDYKVLVFWIDSSKLDTVEIKENGQYCVHSKRNGGWKQLDGFPYAEYDWWDSVWPNRACSMKGVLHWVISSWEVPHVIVTYDMHCGRFGEISVPDVWSPYDHTCATGITELGGQLCCWIFCWNIVCRYQVWAMKEYGVAESWTKLLTIEDSVSRGCFFNYIRNRIEPTRLCETQDGRKVVLFVSCRYGTLYWYVIDNDKVKRVCKKTWLKK